MPQNLNCGPSQLNLVCGKGAHSGQHLGHSWKIMDCRWLYVYYHLCNDNINICVAYTDAHFETIKAWTWPIRCLGCGNDPGQSRIQFYSTQIYPSNMADHRRIFKVFVINLTDIIWRITWDRNGNSLLQPSIWLGFIAIIAHSSAMSQFTLSYRVVLVESIAERWLWHLAHC